MVGLGGLFCVDLFWRLCGGGVCVCVFSFLCVRVLEGFFVFSLVGIDFCRLWECVMSGCFRVFYVCVCVVLLEDVR